MKSVEVFIMGCLMAEAIAILHGWKPLSSILLLPLLAILLQRWRSPSVYLVDFACLKPPRSCRVSFSAFIEHLHLLRHFTPESIAFMSKILHSSGQSQLTSLPWQLHYIPPQTHHRSAINEAKTLLFPVMDSLLSKTRISPLDIDVLIINCSGFCPSPSLTSLVINRYRMKHDIKSFNLSGMGCSASTLAVDAARRILEVYPNSNAVVLSTEAMSTGWYSGNDREKLVLNCLFRMGSAAVLLSNKKQAAKTSKYKLLSTLRTHRAFDDKAYYSAIREEDSNGILGVHLRKDLLHVAGEMLRSHISILGSNVLPLSEKYRYFFSVIRQRYFDKCLKESYIPDFKLVVKHFCLPVSGKPLIVEIAKGLRLDERDIEATIMTLHRFGNQSSSSLWYQLAYMEAKQNVKVGDRVWQLGMGSGPKCNSIILECLIPILKEAGEGPWDDTIEIYPIPSEVGATS